MADPTFAELDALAAKTRHYLTWAAFMLGAAMLILLIDLQLKRSVARQAVAASALYARAAGKAATSGPGTPCAECGDHASDAGVPGMAGTSPVAAPPDHSPGEDDGVAGPGQGGTGDRPARNGGRTRRAAGGSK